MITVTVKLQELLEEYESNTSDELAHEIVKYLKANMKADKPRVDVVLQFLDDHFSSGVGYCQVYTDNVPGQSHGTFHIDPETVELIEMMGAARKLKLFIKNNFSG